MKTDATARRHPPDGFDLNCRCPAAPSDDCPLSPDECRERLELRKAGFAANASSLPRDEIALRLLCAFVGVDWRKAPPGWWFHPNESSRDAWKRVADEARSIFTEQN